MSRPYYTPEQFKNAFWSKVAITANDDLCWEWQGAKCSAGYGNVTYRQEYKRAHVISWEFANGEIPQGMEVCHECDNPACVNPKHLWLGTHKQNMDDRDQKGRGNHPRGIDNHPKLTEENVIQIRERYATGGISLQKLAKEYGVGYTITWNIIHRRKWSHI